MKFLSLLLCLALERFLPVESAFRRFSLLNHYLSGLTRYLPISITQSASAGLKLTGMILPVWLLISSLCFISTLAFSNIATFVLKSSILLYCLGPDNPYRLSSHTSAVFERAHETLFTPLFWFVLLDIPGVLFYRLVERIACLEDSIETDTQLTSTAQYLTALLAWLPIRLFSFTQALVGTFSHTVRYWLDHLLSGYENNQPFAANNGRIAIGLSEGTELKAEDYSHALRLLDRTLILFLVMILIGSLAAWT